jgi:YHS domain-containing protein
MRKKNKVIDPVCGRKINKNKANVVIHYKGEQYYLCSPECQENFKNSPEKYTQSRKGDKTNLLD